MRAECINAIQELALRDPTVVIVASDPGPGFMSRLASVAPDRLMVEGICEQALVGVSAGLASEGYFPFIITLAVFGTRRSYEQLLLDFGLHQLSGCLVGAGGGLNYSMLGPTHLAVDDLSLMSCIPSAAVLAPGDPYEAASLPLQARAHRGVSYIRTSETTDHLPNSTDNIVLGKGRALSEPRPLLFISCGAATIAVQSAVAILEEAGISAATIHIHTVKPIDVDLLSRYAKVAKTIICVEEHRQIGGLSSAVLHALASSGVPILSFNSVGVGDDFPFGYGTYQEMMQHYGIAGIELAEKAKAQVLRYGLLA